MWICLLSDIFLINSVLQINTIGKRKKKKVKECRVFLLLLWKYSQLLWLFFTIKHLYCLASLYFSYSSVWFMYILSLVGMLLYISMNVIFFFPFSTRHSFLPQLATIKFCNILCMYFSRVKPLVASYILFSLKVLKQWRSLFLSSAALGASQHMIV